MKTLSILGSARSNGNTAAVLNRLISGTKCDLVDLSKLKIEGFRYDQVYYDDFSGLSAKILASDFVILATPVYWYSYSALMKVFIDRFSDFLSSQKSSGRLLRGKRFGLVSTGSDSIPDEALTLSYSRFCTYLGIENVGCLYSQNDGPFTSASDEAKFRKLLNDE
jgi:multimeric flavodoxin WrbA